MDITRLTQKNPETIDSDGEEGATIEYSYAMQRQIQNDNADD